MDLLEAGPVPGQGHIAQQVFWCSAFTDAARKSPAVMNPDGTPKWRMAPSPHGAYWKEGMKLGYQDVGCWTMLEYAPMEKVKAGRLHAQFTTSRTVSLKKALTTLHLIRESDVNHMDGLARDQDAIMGRLERSGVMGKLGPKLNKEMPAEHWYAKAEKDGNLAPQRKLADEKPKGETVDYDTLVKSWNTPPPT